MLGHVHGYLLQEMGMGTGLVEADLHGWVQLGAMEGLLIVADFGGLAKNLERSVSRGLDTLGGICGGGIID